MAGFFSDASRKSAVAFLEANHMLEQDFAFALFGQ